MQIRFVDLANVEGLYVSTCPPVIVLGAHRPPGRQSFTCGHEFAHHMFGHGTRLDELSKDESRTVQLEPEELTADCFAASLLMPKAAVCRGFRVRSFDPEDPSPQQVYHVAQWLGVSYLGLLNQMHFTLHLLSERTYEILRRVSPNRIKHNILGAKFSGEVYFVDENWDDRPVDCHVGDKILTPNHIVIDVPSIASYSQKEAVSMYEVTRTGIGRAHSIDNSWATYVRVSRMRFIGLSQYRHLEEFRDE